MMKFESLFRRRARKYGVRPAAAFLSSLGLIAGVPVSAHHSGASFDDERMIELTGTVKEFQWTNPHTWIQLYVQNEQGERIEWSIEAGGPNSLARSGWRPTTFQSGDEVTIQLHPMRNGQPAGGFVGAQFSDGTTIGRWQDNNDAEVDE